MEQVTYFNNFLAYEVNLPQYKLDFLDERVGRIFKVLEEADLGTQVLGMKKQGSWAQRTIINPKEGEEFDADFMLELEEQGAWSPSDYQAQVLDALNNYCDAQQMKTMPEAKNRCVCVTYANYMHVDVVPYVNKASGGEFIVNTDTDNWEKTDPDGFTKWMQDKDDISKGNMRRVLRILKYLRDHRGYYEDTKSIILTTIVGGVVSLERRRSHPGCYDNIPKALYRITSDLSDWVRDARERPEIADPSPRVDSTFTHRWPQWQYEKFRRDIQDVAKLVKKAIDCSPWSDSTDKWRELLGDDFGPASVGNDSKFPAAGAGIGTVAAIDTTTGRSGRAG